MTEQALLEFEGEHGVKFDKITKVPLEGDGTIERRVERCVFYSPIYPSEIRRGGLTIPTINGKT
jgi:hypothetical protein